VADPPTSPPTQRSDRNGTLLAGRYRFERRIAVGGMAEVWEAVDQVLDRPVAIKVLHPHLAGDQNFVDRFRREAIAAARLTHPSIVAIYDTHSSDGDEAIVMELVRGVSLRKHLDDRGPLPAAEAVDIGARVAEALESAHRAGLVHRDIKPANILICEDERVMVADFGIAKLTDADHTTEGTVLGTAKYLAPEQVSGTAVDARTDLYSLGIVLYEMVCGRVPFSGDTDTATVLARLHQDPTPPREIRTEIPRSLEAVILHSLQRDPDDRPASAAALRTELLATLAPSPGDAGTSNDDPTFLESAAAADGTSVVPSPPPPRAATAPPPTGPPAGRARAVSPPPPTGRPAPAAKPARNWTGPALLIGLILVALAVAGVLLGSVLGDNLFGGDEPRVPGVDTGGDGGDAVALTATAFDPEGTGGEHDGEAPLAVDGDLETAWTSETYDSREDFQGIKSGVGLILTLEQASDLGQLVVDSDGTGWAAQVYVADEPADDLAGWGSPVVDQSDLGDQATFDLSGTSGRVVLLWITDLGTGDPVAVINEAGLSPG
jgi:eukaryotic-like serine/threonine-protein kinase